MKRIKQIIEAMRTLGLNPSIVLRDAASVFDHVIKESESDEESAERLRAQVLRQVLEAVADYADEAQEKLAKPAKSPETN